MNPESSALSPIQLKAADVKVDNEIKGSDYVLIKNYIMDGIPIVL